jgi:hypothetical protein
LRRSFASVEPLLVARLRLRIDRRETAETPVCGAAIAGGTPLKRLAPTLRSQGSQTHKCAIASLCCIAATKFLDSKAISP